jgi:ribosomal-protein-alanine N-acetyltransferase
MPSEPVFPDLLKTDRLLLRRYTAADALGLLELVEKNRDFLIRNFPQMAKGFGRVEEAIAFTEEKTLQWTDRKAFCYGLWLKDSKEQIGQILVKNLTWNIPSAELSYFIASQSQRKGFATEAISVILRTAFKGLGFNRIFIRIIPSNQESILLANKLGFKREGLHRNEFRCGFSELHDVYYFSLTNRDYL